MTQIIKIKDLPNVLSVDELLEVKGGLLDNNLLCSVFGTGVKCTVEGSGVCTVEGSGIIIKDPDKPDPNPNPLPDPGPVIGRDD